MNLNLENLTYPLELGWLRALAASMSGEYSDRFKHLVFENQELILLYAPNPDQYDGQHVYGGWLYVAVMGAGANAIPIDGTDATPGNTKVSLKLEDMPEGFVEKLVSFINDLRKELPHAKN